MTDLDRTIDPSRLTPAEVENLTPVDVARHLIEISNRIARGIEIIDRLFAEYQEADVAYDDGFAQAYLEATGPAHALKHIATRATIDLRQARDEAYRKHRHAVALMKKLEDDRSMFQSLNKNVLQAYNAVGATERQW